MRLVYEAYDKMSGMWVYSDELAEDPCECEWKLIKDNNGDMKFWMYYDQEIHYPNGSSEIITSYETIPATLTKKSKRELRLKKLLKDENTFENNIS